ncbi:hypothetical protein FQR65_LT06200 [Abscondita terminalis]|nr:hypothetical protein FQR65_LT06200 [Abscondita terminalis]
MSKERIESLSKLSMDGFKSSSVSNNFSINCLPRCPSHEIRYLKEDFLSLKNVQLKNVTSRDVIPPQTPNSEFNFQETFKPIPPFPNLDNLDIPYVRDKGVKYCISYFGDYFNCTDYKTNFLQFWFLDVLTDCVWCLQDKFQLPINVQKIVIDWFLTFVDLIRNPRRNLSRKAFFTIFKEAILIAAEVVDEGCVSVPLPKQVFQLMEDEEQSEIDSSDLTSSMSSIAINQSDYDNISCIDIEEEAIVRRFNYHRNLDLSTIYTLTETDSNFSQDISLTFGDVEGQISDDMSLYKPDFNIPSRFLKSFKEEEKKLKKKKKRKKKTLIAMSFFEEQPRVYYLEQCRQF